jgi:hypothetical protein
LQYARIMQNLGYFAPWSRQNSWADRVAINNIRKANTPSALATRQAQILKVLLETTHLSRDLCAVDQGLADMRTDSQEDAKFARKFATPHTSQYTGVHESQDAVLDPKYSPWSNDAPRKAYYQGY